MKTLSKSLLNLSAVGYDKLKSHRLLGISVACCLLPGACALPVAYLFA